MMFNYCCASNKTYKNYCQSFNTQLQPLKRNCELHNSKLLDSSTSQVIYVVTNQNYIDLTHLRPFQQPFNQRMLSTKNVSCVTNKLWPKNVKCNFRSESKLFLSSFFNLESFITLVDVNTCSSFRCQLTRNNRVDIN